MSVHTKLCRSTSQHFSEAILNCSVVKFLFLQYSLNRKYKRFLHSFVLSSISSVPYIDLSAFIYTDDEIYKMFNFTQQEINLIEKTVRKFEYTSPFFIRLMTSVNRVSNKEVQDFCDELDKRYPTNK